MESINLRKDIFVSLVSVVQNQKFETLVSGLQEAVQLLEGSYENFELLLVDNGISRTEREQLAILLQEIPCVRILKLSKPVEFDQAVFAGLENAIGDFTVFYEFGVDPIYLIPEFVDELLKGSDIVQGISLSRVTNYSSLIRKFKFWLGRVASGLDVTDNATYYLAFSRRILNSLVTSPKRLHYLRHLVKHIGVKVVNISYEKNQEDNAILHIGNLAGLRIITNYSLRPLRFISLIGIGAATLNLIYAVYVLSIFLSNGAQPGWTTTNLQLASMFFVLFISLAILSEYIARVLESPSQGNDFFILEENVSSRMIASRSRRNVS